MERDDPGSLSSDSDMDDSSDSDDDSEDQCRHTWGLLLHPKINSGQYFQVGVFTTRAERIGGLVFFDDCDFEDVEVV